MAFLLCVITLQKCTEVLADKVLYEQCIILVGRIISVLHYFTERVRVFIQLRKGLLKVFMGGKRKFNCSSCEMLLLSFHYRINIGNSFN